MPCRNITDKYLIRPRSGGGRWWRYRRAKIARMPHKLHKT